MNFCQCCINNKFIHYIVPDSNPLIVNYDNNFIRIENQPTKCLHINIQENKPDSAPENYTVGTEVFVFNYHGGNNQRFLINLDGTISPAVRNDLIIGILRDGGDNGKSRLILVENDDKEKR